MLHRITPVVTAVEYGRVALPPGLDTPRTRERLEAAGLRAGLRTFETRGRSLYAVGVVGVVDVGNVIVEILPKTSDGATASNGTAFLSNLLRFTDAGDALTLTEAAIADTDGSFLELILAWAARTLDRHLRDGYPRRYTPREELSNAVRGRVQLRHLARLRPGRGFELTVRHAPLGDDNVIGRTVKWLAGEIARRTRSLQTRMRSLHLLQSLGSVGDTPPSVRDLDRLVLTPIEERWRPLITFARTLLAQGSPDPARGGRLPAVAVLFRLHYLFQAAVRRVLSEGLQRHDLVLQRGQKSLLASAGDGTDLIRLRPDFMLAPRCCSNPSVVGDAKWKRILEANGPPRLGEADAYQVTTYLAALKAHSAFIVSPLSSPELDVLRAESFLVEGVARRLTLIGVHLPTLISDSLRGDALRRRLCVEIANGTKTEPVAA
ncbi:McrC family protein [Mesorhizobium sp. M0848]|uniref:5-methylcytosine restriction system specificity protein McrC n=1 Tax=Mesorhizobium sp. M0848 TaxID=2957012 RepID=UPI0033356462